MKIRKAQIQQADLICQYLPANYIECLRCNFTSLKKVTPDDIMVAFWTVPPPWVETLFKFRNLLVKPFGIQGENDSGRQELETCIRTGGTYNIMSITAKSEEETILCANDKHLVMYLSVKVKELNESNKEVIISTSTCPWLGHPVSGRILQTLCAINTRFPFGSDAEHLNLACNIHSLDRSTKSTISHI